MTNLYKILKVLSQVVEKRYSVPIIGTVKIEKHDKGLKLTVTDLNMYMSAVVPYQGESPDTCVEFWPLLKYAKSLNGDLAMLETVKDKFECLPLEDFPSSVDKNTYSANVAFDGDWLTRIKHAISQEETRYYLKGVYMHTVDDKLVCVATDGHRLARIDTGMYLKNDDIFKPGEGVIIPHKAALIVNRMGRGDLALGKTCVSFTSGDFKLTSSVIDGQFPDYERVVPKGGEPYAINGEKLKMAIGQLSPFFESKSSSIKLRFNESGLIASYDKHDVIINYDHYEPITIAFNSKYVLDLIAAHNPDILYFKIENASSAVRIDDYEMTHVLMPVRC
jgi:DNA polymerase-3 subunit beta